MVFDNSFTTKLTTMRVNEFNKWDLQPRLLTDEEVANPMLVVHEVFDYAHLPDLRNVLWEWLKTTVCGNYSKSLDYRDRESMLYFYEKMQKLLEAAHLLLVSSKLANPGTKDSATTNVERICSNIPEVVPATELVPIIEQLVALLSPDFLYELGKVQELNSNLPVYYFFVVLPNTVTFTYTECQALVADACIETGTVHLLFTKTNELQKYLLQGHLLYSWLCTEPYLVYVRDRTIVLSADKSRLPELVSGALKEVNMVFTKAYAFYEGAEFYLAKNNYPLAVFMLQQAAEHTLRGFLLGVTGRNYVGHNILVLRRFALPFYKDLIHLLPVGPDKTTCPLRLLGKAYVQARYQNNFSMAVTEISLLKDWIGKLLPETKMVFEKRMGEVLA